MPSISIIICTYNRADILRETLESWRSVTRADQDAELIIVDNNSTDRTAEVVEAFQPHCPSAIRLVREKNAGLSHARNRGIIEAAADLIAFVDDDVYFDQNWLIEILSAFNANPQAACVGGKSIPKFETAAPEWITEDVYKLYGSTCSGDQDKWMTFPEHPFGLNMAFRKTVFMRVGNFNVNLGRVKNTLLSNEEYDFFYRVSQANLVVYYAAKAVLYHRIPAERLNKQWIIKRYYWQGISDVVFWQSKTPRSKWTLAVKSVWLSFNAGTCALRLLLDIMGLKPVSQPFKQKLKLYRLLGMIRQNLVEIVRFTSGR